MDGSVISDDVKTLLRDCIESFEHLEVLLLLHRKPDDTWTADAVVAASMLNLAEDIATDALAHLHRWKLIEGEARRYRYNPSNRLDATIRALATVYEEDRLEVMRLMNQNAIERVRTSALRAFADAFFVGGGGKKTDG
jgi:hypothetical protein